MGFSWSLFDSSWGEQGLSTDLGASLGALGWVLGALGKLLGTVLGALRELSRTSSAYEAQENLCFFCSKMSVPLKWEHDLGNLSKEREACTRSLYCYELGNK